MNNIYLSKNYLLSPQLNTVIYTKKVNVLSDNSPLSEAERKEILLPMNIETKIKIYEDRVNGWYLDNVKKLDRTNDTGFLVLLVACSLIESNQQYFQGEESKNQSAKMFVCGLKRFFKELDNWPSSYLDHLYSHVRCGLFHSGITKSAVQLNSKLLDSIRITDERCERQIVKLDENNKIVQVNDEEMQKYNLTYQINYQITINPHLFLDTVEKGIIDYIEKLKNPKEIELRNRFEQFYDKTG